MNEVLYKPCEFLIFPGCILEASFLSLVNEKRSFRPLVRVHSKSVRVLLHFFVASHVLLSYILIG